jgi:hypothetical protein
MYDFLNPRFKYYGQFSPQNLTFNANLQEFYNQVGYTVALETNGKIEPDEAYRRLKRLWKELKRSKKALLSPPAEGG